jgi:DNA-binding transcriptional LysR family regulator
MNETRRSLRPRRVRGCRGARQLHARGGGTRYVAVGLEPRHKGSGTAARGTAALADYALGIDDRSGRDAAALRASRTGRDSVGVDAVGVSGGQPSGAVRITATKHAATSVLMPVLPGFFRTHPGIQVDVIVDDNLTDIVADRVDAGIRFGDIVEKDMIAIRIGPDIRMAVVGAPSYFADHPAPRTPRELSGHRCINYRHVRSGGLYAWDFDDKGRPFKVRVEGPLVLNNADLIRDAALAGQGLAYVYDDEVAVDIRAGRLRRILQKWSPTFPGYYLYHPSRRQTPPALAALIAALRYKP